MYKQNIQMNIQQHRMYNKNIQMYIRQVNMYNQNIQINIQQYTEYKQKWWTSNNIGFTTPPTHSTIYVQPIQDIQQ